MPGMARREPRGAAGDVFSRFDRMFDEWARMMPFRAVPFPHWREADDLIRVEQFREDGALVVRADRKQTLTLPYHMPQYAGNDMRATLTRENAWMITNRTVGPGERSPVKGWHGTTT